MHESITTPNSSKLETTDDDPLQAFIWSLWWISTHANLQIRTIYLIILSMGMACFHPLARRCFPKTRSLRPKRFCTLNILNRDWRNVAKKASTSLMSAKLIVFCALFARGILRVDSPVSKIIYVPQVWPPRLPWRKCRNMFVGQHMTWLNKKRPQCDPCQTQLTVNHKLINI